MRKQTLTRLARRVLREVWSHPANRSHPIRAVARAIAWQVTKRLGVGPVEREAYGFRLCLPRSSGALSNLSYFGECFDWSAICLLRAYLRSGDRVVDGGANVGMFSYAALQVVGPSGRVDSFEPLPWAAAALRDNCARNGLHKRLFVHQVALSDREGSAQFVVDLDVSSHLRFENGASISRSYTEVQLARLDARLPDGAIALAKLDVEGAEAQALRGFSGHLAEGNPPVLLIEAHDHALRKMGSSRGEVMEILRSYDYELHLFEPEGLNLTPVPKDWGSDVVAVRRDRLPDVLRRLEAGRPACAGLDPRSPQWGAWIV